MPDKLRIVFMGTPDFAVASLKKLMDAGYDIAGVITAPDKPAGRGKKLLASPVKKFALDKGISPENILQPTNLKDPAFQEQLRSLKADLHVVVAFRMLPETVWDMPPLGTINLHASLLPDYRGAAPINWAIINGESESGVSTFFIEKEIDTGKIIFQKKVNIHPEMNAGELHDELMITGAGLLDETLAAIKTGNYPQVPQNTLMRNRSFSAAPKIFKEDCLIHWEDEPQKIHNQIRGLSPYPAAYTFLTDGTKKLMLKIFKTRIEDDATSSTPTLSTDGKSFLKVDLPGGSLQILELQLEGRKRMNTVDFLRGFKDIGKFKIYSK